VLWFGWRSAFFITGIFGVAWLIAWWTLYRHPSQQPGMTEGELAWIQQDPADKTEKIGWGRLITLRETWAYALAKFLIDPIWWFFLFWLPGYLFDRYHLDLKSFGLPLAAIYIISDLAACRGWLSSFMLKRGFSVNVARKLAMLICAFCVLPIYFAQSIESVWGAVLVIGLATAAHQAFSANVTPALGYVPAPRWAAWSALAAQWARWAAWVWRCSPVISLMRRTATNCSSPFAPAPI
jgi:ACS family hexuronate transporter-like MFS transporter